MKIDKEKLIELLVEKTEMSREEIEKQLEQLIERIVDAAERGKALEIKDFGLFYFDEHGELRFEAAKELSTEISFKYAGMKPVELKPGKSLEPEEEDDLEEEEVDDLESEEMEEEAVEPLSEDDNLTSGEEPEEDEKDPFEEGEFEPVVDPKPAVESKKDFGKSRTSSPASARRKKDNTGIYVLLAIVLVAVLIGGYFYYTQSDMGTGNQETDTTVTMQDPNPVGMTDGEIAGPAGENAEGNTESEPATGDNETTEESGQETAEQQAPQNNLETGTATTDQALYGLRGSVLDEANNGYSIVLHSFTDESNARNTAERLRNDNYRVIVVTRSVQGQTVWRVSVGQFSSLEDAQRATAQLPTPYNERNFIHRIQIN